MGCSCFSFTLPDLAVNDFWANLPIREKPYNDIADVIHIKKQINQAINQKKFSLLVESLMKGENTAYEQAVELFTQALEQARKIQNEGLVFLSLITLGKGDKANFISAFVELAMTVGGLKSSIRMEDKEKSKLIKRMKLEEFLEYHVRLVTQMGIPILHSLYDNKDLYEAYWAEKVTEVKIRAFVNDVLMSKYNNEKSEWIDLEQFLNDCFESLVSDNIIRSYFTAEPSRVQSKKKA